VEQERLVRLVNQCGDVTDIDGLLEIDELVCFPQAVEKLPEGLLHELSPPSAERPYLANPHGAG